MSFFFLIGIKNAYAPPPPPAIPTYTWSAHGSTSIGVYRSSIAAFGYSKGNCAHCHEQHASIGGAEPEPVTGTQEYLIFRNLFGDQNGGFCYFCHTDLGDTNQQQISMPPQYNYSRIAGGDTTISCPDDVLESFVFINQTCGGSRSNCSSSEGSAHCLEDIQDYIKNQWNFGVESTVNPCSGCHNPHRAQYDPHDSSRMTGQKLPGVVSRPSQHSKDNRAWQLWGDDLGERMSDYTGLYQAPCQYQWGDPCTEFEPDGSATTNGSNMFDSVTFCLDCHGNASDPVYSTRYSRDLTVIDWGVGGDKHGKRDRENYRIRLYPYTGSQYYVLSCLDCHEPHGSRHRYLLRQTVNGTQVPDFTWPNTDDLCFACHSSQVGGYHGGTTLCSSSSCHVHGNGDLF